MSFGCAVYIDDLIFVSVEVRKSLAGGLYYSQSGAVHIKTLEHIRVYIHYGYAILADGVPYIFQVLALLGVQDNKLSAGGECVIYLRHRPCKAEADKTKSLVVFVQTADLEVSFQ